MKYSEARSTIQSGDLLAWSHRGWKTLHDLQVQAVRLFTMSEYSHVGIAWVIAGRVFILESVTGGIRIVPLSKFLPFYLVKIGNWNDKAEEFAMSKMGQKYSKLEAIMGFLQLLSPGEDESWQCAEYAGCILRQLDVDVGSIFTPAALVSRQLELGRSVIMVTKD